MTEVQGSGRTISPFLAKTSITTAFTPAISYIVRPDPRFSHPGEGASARLLLGFESGAGGARLFTGLSAGGWTSADAAAVLEGAGQGSGPGVRTYDITILVEDLDHNGVHSSKILYRTS